MKENVTALSFTVAVLALFLLLSLLRLLNALHLFHAYFCGVVTCLLIELSLCWHYLVKAEKKVHAKLASRTTFQDDSDDLAESSDVKPELAEPLVSGILTFQISEKKKVRLFFSLSGHFLHYRPVSQSGKDQQVSEYARVGEAGTIEGYNLPSSGVILLKGAMVRLLHREHKNSKPVIRVTHPNCRLLPDVDCFYLNGSSRVDSERWYFALLTCCTQETTQQYAEMCSKLKSRLVNFWYVQESANWLNVLLAYIHMSMRQSDAFKNRIAKKVVSSLSRVSEKNLFDYVSNFEVLEVNLGTRVPNIENAILVPPDHTGDFITDIWITYTNGDVSIKLSFDVHIKRFATVPVKLTVYLKSLLGRLQLRYPPYPSEKINVSFSEEPNMQMSLDLVVGEKTSQLKNVFITKLKEIIISRLKQAFFEKFVSPRGRYIRIGLLRKPDPPVTKKERVGDDRPGGDKVGDGKVGDEKVGDEKVGDDKVGDDKVGDDNSLSDSYIVDQSPPLTDLLPTASSLNADGLLAVSQLSKSSPLIETSTGAEKGYLWEQSLNEGSFNSASSQSGHEKPLSTTAQQNSKNKEELSTELKLLDVPDKLAPPDAVLQTNSSVLGATARTSRFRSKVKSLFHTVGNSANKNN
ncbi:uncharacterized protein LOC126318220 isoform X2 [Schistocerca gregaria]|uniref:uncharacterized protein LOC126318220 isoform X2 n=1 Tax=Schistocerca gregaria TaxID=7010 RepID=UPI00211E93E8|nr:uncharacterized protein LOC126318220 isoform X2 [Schistocerca gregaria]